MALILYVAVQAISPVLRAPDNDAGCQLFFAAGRMWAADKVRQFGSLASEFFRLVEAHFARPKVSSVPPIFTAVMILHRVHGAFRNTLSCQKNLLLRRLLVGEHFHAGGMGNKH